MKLSGFYRVTFLLSNDNIVYSGFSVTMPSQKVKGVSRTRGVSPPDKGNVSSLGILATEEESQNCGRDINSLFAGLLGSSLEGAEKKASRNKRRK